ncbi:PREDICTED: DNA ligase 1-like [Branchiostoma belcheri]|uniref:DNA ligase 1-like n=1 Tax=Branchiostoma belcheri TaxID=7741 RepID=A0A6P4YHM2_BRABE|nr:PREDICTED: DNA ligase 1-like [Branchiostoma belcheri]
MEASEMSEKPLVEGSAAAKEDVKEKFETEESAEVSPEEKMRGEIEALLEKTSGEIEKLEEEKQKRGIKEEGSETEKKPLISEEGEEKAAEEETWATLKEKEPEEPPKSPEVLPENITMEVSELYDPDGSPVEKESPSFLWQSEDQLWEEVPPAEGADDKDKEKPGDKKKDKKKTKEEKDKEKEKKKKEKEEKMKEKKEKDEKAKQEKKERDEKAKKEKKEKDEKAKKEKKEKDEKAKKEKKEKDEKAKKEKKEKEEKAKKEKKEKDEKASAEKKEKDEKAAKEKKEKDEKAAAEKKEKDEKAAKEKKERDEKAKKEKDEKVAKEKERKELAAKEKEEKAAKEKEEKAAKAKQEKEEKLKQKEEEEAEKDEQQIEVETKAVEEEKEKLMPKEKEAATDPDAIEILAEEGLIPAERRKPDGIWEENKKVIILGIVAFVLVVIITIAIVVPLTQGRPYRMEPYLNFSITTTWNSTPIAQPLNFSLESGERPGSTPTDPPVPGLTVNMDLPFYGVDPAPAGPPGQPFDQLWNYEVFEIFFLGPEDRYLEVEFGPYGHHLVLRLQGSRQLIETKLPLQYTARRTGSRWTGQAFIPWDYIPPQLGWMNAYGIHNTSNSERRYLALYPVPREDLAASGEPDFHRLGYFKPLNVSVLYPAGWKQPLPERWATNRVPAPLQETPVQETPVQETPVQETPVQETPVQTPEQETADQESPVEQT